MVSTLTAERLRRLLWSVREVGRDSHAAYLRPQMVAELCSYAFQRPRLATDTRVLVRYPHQFQVEAPYWAGAVARGVSGRIIKHHVCLVDGAI